MKTEPVSGPEVEEPTPVAAEPEEDDDEGDAFKTWMAIAIAVVTLLGAVIAWRAGEAIGYAQDADLYSLRATLNAEGTLTLNAVELYRHYRAYTAYRRYSQVGNQLEGASDFVASEVLGRQDADSQDLAGANALFFPRRYLNRDGSYDSARELAENWAQATQTEDLDPEPYLLEGDLYRARTLWLVGALVPLAVALLIYTLAEALHASRTGYRILTSVVGTVLVIAAIAMWVLGEI
jgi:hypothetical protein